MNALLLGETPVTPKLAQASGQAPTEVEASILNRLKPAQEAWRVTFVPSPALAAQAVNVNSVRAHLQQLGDILQAAPAVRPGGQISFSFILATVKPEDELESSFPQGVSFERFMAPANPEVTPEPPAKTEPARPPLTHSVANVVRVDLARLDDLMQKVG